MGLLALYPPVLLLLTGLYLFAQIAQRVTLPAK